MTKKRPTVKTPKHGYPWPKHVKARFLELLRDSKGNVVDARKLLDELYIFDPKAPNRSTVIDWGKAAGIELVTRRPRDTTPATDARLAKLDEDRRSLSELLLGGLSRPSAELIASRLQSAVAVQETIDIARLSFTDAMKLEAQAIGDYPDPESKERKGARAAVRSARLALEIALESSVGVRDLVGVLTRAIADHLTLEGKGEDDEAVGDLIVEIHVPRPEAAKSDAAAVPEGKLAELKLVAGGEGDGHRDTGVGDHS